MAVANTKSTIVTNADATPRILTALHLFGGVLKSLPAIVEVAAADDAASVYRLFRVHSSWRIEEVLLASDAITGLDDVNVGVYDTAANGGAVVNENLFADDLDLSSGLTWTDVTYETTATNIDKVEKRLWELLGLSADPQKEYDICVTAIADPGGAGTIAGLLRYSDNT